MKKNKKNGFTLFELLVSISIIGILTAVASIAYSGAQKKARDARRVEDIKLIQTAAEQFYSQSNYVYPANNTTTIPWASNNQNILEIFPVDPKNDAANGYVYNYTPLVGGYCTCAKVENSMNGNSVLANCTIVTSSANTVYFCAKNQQ